MMQERHPSALDRFDALAAAAKGKQVAVFLDYDGTLSPIVEDPDRAVMTDEVRAWLFFFSLILFSFDFHGMDEKSRACSASYPSSNKKPRNKTKQYKEMMRIPVGSDADDVVNTQMREAVRGVAARFPTAIVSGRCRDKV
jgi:hypothetical protein